MFLSYLHVLCLIEVTSQAASKALALLWGLASQGVGAYLTTAAGNLDTLIVLRCITALCWTNVWLRELCRCGAKAAQQQPPQLGGIHWEQNLFNWHLSVSYGNGVSEASVFLCKLLAWGAERYAWAPDIPSWVYNHETTKIMFRGTAISCVM